MCAANILFELTGSIAAWKACAVISRLVQDGHAVQTLATRSALRFVGAATLEGMTGRPVRSDLWEPGAAMEHINLVKWADLVIVCPATANTINRLASGHANDLLGSLFLAHDWRKPFLLAPAMNPAMWGHPATAASVERLKSWGVRILPVASGRMACGDEGEGRLIEPEEILAAIRAHLPTTRRDSAAKPGGSDGAAGATASSRSNRRLRVLVTSGGTEEPIDGVRSLGNFSTGRTGARIAAVFADRGHDVLLLRAQRAAPAPPGVREECYRGFADLESALRRLLREESFDAVIHAAAVGDYSIDSLVVDGTSSKPGVSKLDSGHKVEIHLRPNPKLVDQLRAWSVNTPLGVVAFKLTRNAEPPAIAKAVSMLFEHSGADVVVHNDLSEQGEGEDDFPATIHLADGAPTRVTTRQALALSLEAFLTRIAAPAPAAS